MIEKLAEELTSIPAISGNERKIANFLREKFEQTCDEVIFDYLGSIYGVKKSQNKEALRVMIHGHMDELGFIVNQMKENGTILALCLGKIDKNTLIGQKISLYNQDGVRFKGTILAQDSKQTAINDKNQVLIDIGMSTIDEITQSAIELGDMVVFDQPYFTSYNKKRHFASNWNGRVAPLSILQLLEQIREKEYPFDLYLGCSVQEHVGLRGAQTATNLVKPDLALVIDTQRAEDYLKDGDKENGMLGQGFLLTYYDISVLPSRKAMEDLKSICQSHKIDFQYYYSMNDSDAGWINKLCQGTPVAFFNIAVRNTDAPVQEIDIHDLKSLLSAVESFLGELTPEKIIDFKNVNE